MCKTLSSTWCYDYKVFFSLRMLLGHVYSLDFLFVKIFLWHTLHLCAFSSVWVSMNDSECHKKFARLTNLKSHMLTHTRKKPHECSECHKKFLLLSTLRSHMLTHTGKKQHECSECHKKFSQSYNLQRHMLTHTGEKPHKCSECHKKFSQSCNLQSHMLTHTEEKAHKCSVCHRRFSQKGSLKIHMSKQHSQWEENLIIITPLLDTIIIIVQSHLCNHGNTE